MARAKRMLLVGTKICEEDLYQAALDDDSYTPEENWFENAGDVIGKIVNKLPAESMTIGEPLKLATVCRLIDDSGQGAIARDNVVSIENIFSANRRTNRI
jgi:Flp pilus assembly protein CpaB